MSLSVTRSKPCEELRKQQCRRVRDALAQDLAVRVRVGDLPERVERCVEVHRGLPRERGRSLDLRWVAVFAIHDCGNEQRVKVLDHPWRVAQGVRLGTRISERQYIATRSWCSLRGFDCGMGHPTQARARIPA